MQSFARMPWVTAALAAALLAATATAADPKDKDAKDKEAPAKVDKDVEAWVNVLAGKIADRHDSIRDSARMALIAVGKPALPALQKLAEGADGAAAEAAKRVIAHIEGGHDGREGFHPHRGFPGEMGRGGPGFHWGSPPPHPGAPGAGPRPGGPPGQPGRFGPRPGGPGADPGAPPPPGGSSGPGAGPGAPPPPGGGRRGPEGFPGGAGFGGPSGFAGGAAPSGAFVGNIWKDINLTDAQKTKVQEVLKAQADKAREAREKMHEDLLKALKGVLDEEQYKKFEKSHTIPPSAPGDLPKPSDKPTPPKE